MFLFWKENRVNLNHIESRPSKNDKGRYEFYVDCKAQSREHILAAVEKLKEKATYLHLLNKQGDDVEMKGSGKLELN